MVTLVFNLSSHFAVDADRFAYRNLGRTDFVTGGEGPPTDNGRAVYVEITICHAWS